MLVVISPLKGFLRPGNRVILTEKFVDGMRLYRELWQAPILHICEPSSAPSSNLDNVEVPMNGPDFRTICAPITDDLLRASIPQGSVVLSTVGEQFNSVSAICNEIGANCVYLTEYNLRTRHQIANEYRRSFLQGEWAKYKQTKQEGAQRKAISLASGVQCNGVPTYEDYKNLTPSAHLFFDTRSDGSMLASIDSIERKAFERRLGRKLHLVFSGRLNLMKGVDDLIKVAGHLRPLLNDWFHLSICGDGEYADQLRKDITVNGLQDLITMRGNLDFKTELVPFVTNEADIFVCCHRQGDPSCTYLETMACGVPVVGYDNDAWRGLSDLSRSGRVKPLGNPKAIAEEIALMDRQEETIETEARRSLAFASLHTFEQTFRGRIEHLRRVSDFALDARQAS